ncbi:MAG: cation:proton antiporter [Patescibacteria group bacterium]
MPHLFIDISFLVIFAAALGLLAHRLKQPILLAYIAAGFILGPAVSNYLGEPDFIHTLSTFGIALVLFLVGLELNLDKLGSLGRVSLKLGISQVLITGLLGFVLVKLTGLNILTAVYLGIALTFSSTIVVIKLLSEQRALESLYGRLAVGVLLVQDILAIITLVILSAFQPDSGNNALAHFITIVGKGFVLLSILLIAYRFILKKLFTWLAKSTELLLLSSIGWCLLMAVLAASLGFSVEIGAFLAGLSLSTLPYHLEIVGRVRPLRDFFITVFFVALGTQLNFSSLENSWALIGLLLVFALLIKPLIIMATMGLMGYHRRTGFMTGLSLAQISEFSLIIMALGLRLNHVSNDLSSVVLIVGIVSITLSSYFITYSENLYRLLNRWLSIFQSNKKEEVDKSTNLQNHVVVFGYHRLGEKIVSTLQKLEQKVLVIDFDPLVVNDLKRQKIDCFYGDMADLEILEKAQINQAKMIISTVPDVDDNLLLIKDMNKQQAQAPVYLTATTWHDTKTLYEAGADYVIFPHHLSGEHFGLMLQNQLMNKNRFLVDKTKHLRELELHYAARQRN